MQSKHRSEVRPKTFAGGARGQSTPAPIGAGLQQMNGERMPPVTDDTKTPTGRAMWQMIGLLAELERSLITERTRAGVKAAQRRGVKFGRKAKLTPDRLAHARKLIDQGKSPTEAAKIIGIARATIYRALQRAAAA
jgi:DNA invertase Pin-like site-specific DNA recombinase